MLANQSPASHSVRMGMRRSPAVTGEPAAGDQPIETVPPSWADSRERWLRERAYLNHHRYGLAKTAQNLYPAEWRVASTPLLARPEWLPLAPIPLDQVRLSWRPEIPPNGIDGTE